MKENGERERDETKKRNNCRAIESTKVHEHHLHVSCQHDGVFPRMNNGNAGRRQQCQHFATSAVASAQLMCV